VDKRMPRNEEDVVERQRGFGANAVRQVSHL
jgi:hypothetical protein